MKVCDLFEAEEKKEEKLLPVDSIAVMLFKKKAGIVIDAKRDKDKKYIGVAHEKSMIKDANGRTISLTFDNSTDSGDFEIDSLTPLKIEKGGDIDKEIKKLFIKYDLDTKKKTGYVVKGDIAHLREIHLGKKLGRPAVKLVSDLIRILKKLEGSDESEESVEDLKKDSKAEKKPIKKPVPKEESIPKEKPAPKEEKPAPKEKIVPKEDKK